MTDTVNSVAPQAAKPPRQTGAVAAASTETFTTATAPVASSSLEQALPHISPSVRQDAATGVMVTEFYNSKGDVQTQYPSKAALSYIRIGLTATGEPEDKPDTNSAEKPASKTVLA